MSKKVKVLIVEDSFLMRKFLKEILEEDPEIKVVGMAKDGKEALRLVENLNPDVVTLDYEMPGMNGIEVLERIMKKRPIPCIMVSAYTREGAEVTLEALSRGAFDFVPKPSGELSLDIMKVRDELIGKIKAGKGAKVKNIVKEYEDLKKPLSGNPVSIDAVGIASSTGGTTVVEYLVRNLPENLNIPVFIVQHMPVVFTKKFARRLSEITGKDVRETEHGEKVRRNAYYVAKGGVHMALKKKGDHIYIVHNDFPPRNGVKPSADYLFESMAKVYGERSLGIILTGMGKDGVEGARKIKNRGGLIWAQSKETCLIFGMPKNAIREKIVNGVFSPEEIVKNLVKI